MSKVAMFPQAIHDFNKPDGRDHSFRTEGPSLTRQEFKDECDINSLMARYEGHVIGGPGNIAPANPIYFDFAEAPQTLLEFMSFMQDAEKAFMSLPAAVRKEFDNNAPAFVDYASDPLNIEQMRAWGLAPPAKAPEEPPTAKEGEPGPAPGGSPGGSS